jgi:hypothetical protein
MFIIFFDIGRLFTIRSFSQAKYSIPQTTLMFRGNCVTICEDFAPGFGNKNWLLHHGNALSHTSFFTRDFLTKSNMTVVP